MARQTEWWVLGLDKDPTPGNGSVVAGLIARMTTLADEADRARNGVVGLLRDKALDSWMGASGDAFRDACDPLPDQLVKVRTSYEDCATALKTYQTALGKAAQRADNACADAMRTYNSFPATQTMLVPRPSAAMSDAEYHRWVAQLEPPPPIVPNANPLFPQPSPLASPTLKPSTSPTFPANNNGLFLPSSTPAPVWTARQQAMVSARAEAIAAAADNVTAAQSCQRAIDDARRPATTIGVHTPGSGGKDLGTTFDERFKNAGGDPAKLILDPAAGVDVETVDFPVTGTSPDDVARWWAGLDDATRGRYVHDHPTEVAGLNGIPQKDRDAANAVLHPKKVPSGPPHQGPDGHGHGHQRHRPTAGPHDGSGTHPTHGGQDGHGGHGGHDRRPPLRPEPPGDRWDPTHRGPRPVHDPLPRDPGPGPGPGHERIYPGHDPGQDPSHGSRPGHDWDHDPRPGHDRDHDPRPGHDRDHDPRLGHDRPPWHGGHPVHEQPVDPDPSPRPDHHDGSWFDASHRTDQANLGFRPMPEPIHEPVDVGFRPISEPIHEPVDAGFQPVTDPIHHPIDVGHHNGATFHTASAALRAVHHPSAHLSYDMVQKPAAGAWAPGIDAPPVGAPASASWAAGFDALLNGATTGAASVLHPGAWAPGLDAPPPAGAWDIAVAPGFTDTATPPSAPSAWAPGLDGTTIPDPDQSHRLPHAEALRRSYY